VITVLCQYFDYLKITYTKKPFALLVVISATSSKLMPLSLQFFPPRALHSLNHFSSPVGSGSDTAVGLYQKPV